MRLFLSFEAQNATEIGIAKICHELNQRLAFVTSDNCGLEDVNNYGSEFRIISIIPTCVDSSYLEILGWKERKQFWRKKKSADIRIMMNYKHFINETYRNKQRLFLETIIKSIEIVQTHSKEDFNGTALIEDILKAMNNQSGDGQSGDGSVIDNSNN